jgi:hypothetical protein
MTRNRLTHRQGLALPNPYNGQLQALLREEMSFVGAGQCPARLADRQISDTHSDFRSMLFWESLKAGLIERGL